jgi:hypothetical protein
MTYMTSYYDSKCIYLLERHERSDGQFWLAKAHGLEADCHHYWDKNVVYSRFNPFERCTACFLDVPWGNFYTIMIYSIQKIL